MKWRREVSDVDQALLLIGWLLGTHTRFWMKGARTGVQVSRHWPGLYLG